MLAFLILAGNTCMPLGLRFLVYMVRNFSYERTLPKYQQPLRCTFGFVRATKNTDILMQPTRCSIHIFPSVHTKILMLVFFILNLSDTLSFWGFQQSSGINNIWLVGFFLAGKPIF